MGTTLCVLHNVFNIYYLSVYVWINTFSEFLTLIKEIILTFMTLFRKEILKLNNIILEFYYYPRNFRS